MIQIQAEDGMPVSRGMLTLAVKTAQGEEVHIAEIHSSEANGMFPAILPELNIAGKYQVELTTDRFLPFMFQHVKPILGHFAIGSCGWRYAPAKGVHSRLHRRHPLENYKPYFCHLCCDRSRWSAASAVLL
jgi:hypothetical protein